MHTTRKRFAALAVGTLSTIALTVAATVPSLALSTGTHSNAATERQVAEKILSIQHAPVLSEPLDITELTDNDAEQINLLAQSVTFNNQTVVFDYTQALFLGVDENFVSDYARGILLSGGTVQNISSPELVTFSQSDEELLQTFAACRGTNGVGYYWWGHQLRLNSCNTDLVVGALNGGAGIAAVAAIITSATGAGAVAGTIAAAVLVIDAGAISSCNMYGKGIYLNQLWTGTPFCWGQ